MYVKHGWENVFGANVISQVVWQSLTKQQNAAEMSLNLENEIIYRSQKTPVI